MKAFNKFLKKIRNLNIEVFEYNFIEGADWVKAKDFDNLPKNLKKSYWWELKTLNENKLKKLQSNAINELSLLSDGQLRKILKRLELINEFKVFFDFVKKFYVKFDNKTHTGLDLFDFKRELGRLFYDSLPEKGNFDINFLHEVQDQLFFKSALLDGLKFQIEEILNPQNGTLPPQPKTDYWSEDVENEKAIQEFEKAVNKIVENVETENNFGCFPMRFRVLPRTILNEGSYSQERKKYLLKKMFIVLEQKKAYTIVNQLLSEFLLNVEPYPDIYTFLKTEPQQSTKSKILEANIERSIPNINDYSNALDNEAFKLILEPNLPNGNPRNGYYATIIDNWVEVRKKGLTDSNTFQDRTQWLCDFLEIHCARLLTHTVMISKYANLYYYSNDPKHKGKFEGEYLKLFRFLKTFDTLCISLELNRNANVGLAIDMQGYCISRINELIGRIERDFFIKVQYNPIVIHFKEVKDKIENCIDIDKERFINEKQLFENEEGNKLDKSGKPKPQQTNEFSVLEWATIFYYADETKLLPKDKFVKSRIEQFMDAHKISTTFNSFKKNYHTAKNRINKNNDYPIDKLELILPFLEKNYKQAVTLILRDIDFLLSEKSEYQ